MSGTWVYYTRGEMPADVPDIRGLLGGKGASLCEMTRAGLPVPPAFIITTACCAQFLASGGRWPEGLEDQVRAHLRQLEADEGRPYAQGRQPLLVSVRSGAAVSMPGMMDTILNGGLHPALAEAVGDTPRFWQAYLQFVAAFARSVAALDPEALGLAGGSVSDAGAGRAAALRAMDAYRARAGRPFPTEPFDILRECINAVFRSWNSERAVAYRRRNGIHGLPGTAVTVQAMFPSHVSGVLFTRDPTRIEADHMVVEASFGLGESVVSGGVAPDRFIIRRPDFAVTESVCGRKANAVVALDDAFTTDPSTLCLDEGQIRELAGLATRVERHFGHPLDIEWGWRDGRFALLQCRPIRGLDVLQDVEVGRREEINRLRVQAGGTWRVWAAHNLGETLRAPTPLTWDIMRRFMSGRGGFGRMYRDFGYRPAPIVDREGFLDLIGGRVYSDPERQAQLFWAGMPLRYTPAAVLRNPRVLESAPREFDPDRVEPSFLLRLPSVLRAMRRSARLVRRARPTAGSRFTGEILPGFLDYVRAARELDLAALPTPAVIAELEARNHRVLDAFGAESLKPGFLGGAALVELTDLLRLLAGGTEGAALAEALTSGLETDLTFDQDLALYAVARGEQALAPFLERFGHRCAGEMELAVPRWREDPSALEPMLAALRAPGARSPRESRARNVERRLEAERRLPDTLAEWGGSALREDVRARLAEAQALLPFRENGKFHLMQGYELLRQAILELARRWELGDDIFFLRLAELPACESDRPRFLDVIGGRKLRWQSAQRLSFPAVIDSRNLEHLGFAEPVVAAAVLEGEGVAAGIATGPARIVRDPAQPGALGSGYVLVCPSTDPGWTPLFVNAAGLVVERGGLLSHGAIVARDFGIPAVVCADATRRIPPGARVRVDGNRGTLHVLER